MENKKIMIWLKELFNNIGSLLLSIILVILALGIILICAIGAFIWKVVVTIKSEKRKARDIIRGTSHFFKSIAIALDQLGNVAFAGFLNWLFIIPESEFQFGQTHETVSEVLGWNEKLGNLTSHGRNMVSILNWIEKDHCEKAMISGLFDAKYKINQFKILRPRLETIEETQLKP